MIRKKRTDNILEFTKRKLSIELPYDEMPVINLIRATLKNFKSNWLKRFSSARLVVKIQFDAKGFSESPVPLGALISPHHSKPNVEINQTVRYESPYAPKLTAKQRWVIEVSLLNFVFEGDESVEVEHMDTSYINRRLDDWEMRINNFYVTLTDWVSGLDGYTTKHSSMPDMNEEIMKKFSARPRKINCLDIRAGKKLAMLVKPFALWTLGGNGRIDLMTSSRNYIVVDTADHFDPPKWEIFPNDSRTKGVTFTKQNFLNILRA